MYICQQRRRSFSDSAKLVYLLVREPLARLQILLLERRVQYTQPAYLARRRRVVALDVGLLFAVCRLEGGGACSLSRRISELFSYRISRWIGCW
jgi:hypothetical protein